MKGWRTMRAALSQIWWVEHTQHSREFPDVPTFDLEAFERRLSDTERRMQAEEQRRLQVLALEGEIPRGHTHDGN